MLTDIQKNVIKAFSDSPENKSFNFAEVDIFFKDTKELKLNNVIALKPYTTEEFPEEIDNQIFFYTKDIDDFVNLCGNIGDEDFDIVNFHGFFNQL